jgi:6-pyruvoyltetrahydropterin/6-carboxytetrahydropterin synthase
MTTPLSFYVAVLQGQLDAYLKHAFRSQSPAMYRITKKFGPYAAMHFLTSVPPGHQCGEEHGHNYEIELVLSSPTLNAQGFVVDYGELRAFDQYAASRMDHKNINKQFSFPTTAENLAKHFYDWIQNTTTWPIEAVRVSETPGKTMGEYCRPDPPRSVRVETHTQEITFHIHAEPSRLRNFAIDFRRGSGWGFRT